MSVFSKIGKALKKNIGTIATVASFIPGLQPVGFAAKALSVASKVSKIAGVVGGIRTAIKGTPRPTTLSSQFDSSGSFIDITQAPLNMSILGALPTLGRAAGAVIPAAGRAVVGAGRVAAGTVRRFLNTPGGKWTKKGLRDAGLIAVGGLVYDAAGNLLGTVQRRRMNPLNARALRRSIRRVKSARGICQDIERMLPKKRSAPSCAPRKRKC